MSTPDAISAAISALADRISALEGQPAPALAIPNTVNITKKGEVLISKEPPSGPVFALMSPTTVAVPAANEPSGIVVHPNGEYVYVSCYQAKLIRVFKRNTTTGNLTALSEKAVPVGRPATIAIDPEGSFLYAYTQSEQSIVSWTIEPAGTLAEIGHIAVPKGAGSPPFMTIGPTGRFLYVTAFGEPVAGEKEYLTTWESTAGALSLVGHIELAAGGLPCRLAVSPDNGFLYVLKDQEPNSHLNIFKINGAALEAVHEQALPPGLSGIACSPDNLYLYIGGAGSVFLQYERNVNTGLLTALKPEKVEIGTLENGHAPIIVAPDGRAVYMGISTSNEVAQVPRSVMTGCVQKLAPENIGVGGVPEAIAMSPDGKSLYTANANNTIGSFTTE